MKQKAILITGAPHSGTRLLVNMLARHAEVSVPLHILNPVGEFYPLHKYFVRMIDRTPLHYENYYFDFDELRFLLDSYIQEVEPGKSAMVIKMPYYPLNCLDFFYEYFQDNLKVVFTSRNPGKVYSSYSRRGADALFNRKPDEHVRQVKKLPIGMRKTFLTEPDKARLIKEIVRTTEEKKDSWNSRHQDEKIITIKASYIAQSSQSLQKLLHALELPVQDLEEMHSVVNQGRLMVGRSVKLKDIFWKNWSRLKVYFRNRG